MLASPNTNEKDKLERIQENIGKKIGLFDVSWKDIKHEEKALEIFRILSKKKFVLLLDDDLWELANLTEVGVSLFLATKTVHPKLYSQLVLKKFVALWKLARSSN